ncbi:hypothetical protein BKA70DRAFT_1437082 [Coprinopsis sp. MPI-PUGE-AT-0042]|nr:hypothetical protein BKA70DRAFT_1437082 [Coprinopsis sp. MPI-PUGE-AT-0042]
MPSTESIKPYLYDYQVFGLKEPDLAVQPLLLQTFVMNLSLAAFVALATTIHASAQSLSIGPGCAEVTKISVDYRAIDYTPPSGFAAITGPNIPVILSRRNCQASVNAIVPAGWKFRHAETTTPIIANVPPGGIGSVENVYYFSGSTPTISGPPHDFTTSGSFSFITHYYPRDLWSPCGGETTVNINTIVTANGTTFGTTAIGGTINTPIIWEACN